MNLAQLYALNDKQRFPSFGFAGNPSGEERPSTLFYADFKVAEAFGLDAVRETFQNCGDLNRRDWKEVAELAVVLNYLLWDAHDRGDKSLEKLYTEYWHKVNSICSAWTDEARAEYYFRLTD